MIGKNTQYVEYYHSPSDSSTETETTCSESESRGSNLRISKYDAELFEKITKKEFKGEIESTVMDIIIIIYSIIF